MKTRQYRKLPSTRTNKPFLPVRAVGPEFLGDQKIHRRAADHQRQEPPVPPAVKQIAGAEDEEILGPVAEAPVHQHHRDQKQEIYGGIEQHGESEPWTAQRKGVGRTIATNRASRSCGLEPAAIPEAADSPELGENRSGNVIHESPVQSETERCAPGQGERDVVARHFNALESVVFLEVAQAVTLFVPL